MQGQISAGADYCRGRILQGQITAGADYCRGRLLQRQITAVKQITSAI